MPEGNLSRDDWYAIFRKPAPFPEDLPDDLVRTIADLRIIVGNLGQQVSAGLTMEDLLVTWMGPSLLSGALKRLEGHILRIQEQRDGVTWR